MYCFESTNPLFETSYWRNNTAPDPQSVLSVSYAVTPECCCTKFVFYPTSETINSEHQHYSKEYTSAITANEHNSRNGGGFYLWASTKRVLHVFCGVYNATAGDKNRLLFIKWKNKLFYFK